MEVTVRDVTQVFLALLNGTMTREGADRWAYSIVKASELGNLTFVPSEDEVRIWEGVMYLYGIDLMENLGTYLHTDDDIRSSILKGLDNLRDEEGNQL